MTTKRRTAADLAQAAAQKRAELQALEAAHRKLAQQERDQRCLRAGRLLQQLGLLTLPEDRLLAVLEQVARVLQEDGPFEPLPDAVSMQPGGSP